MTFQMEKKNNQDNPKLYEQPGHWNKLLGNPAFLEKARLIKAMIPEDVRRILDAGCGDGALTNMFLDTPYQIVGMDRSQEALKLVQTKKMLGSLDNIPCSDGEFDLVICSQVLEHLPRDILSKAVVELARVAGKYLIISVPYKEQLRKQYTRCAQCGFIYHTWGHVRAFNSVDELRRLFPGFQVNTYYLCARAYYMNPVVLFIKQFIGNEWAWDATA